MASPLLHITLHNSSSVLLERQWSRLRGHPIMGRYGGGFTLRATVLTEAEPAKLHHDELQVDLFACPICFKQLTRKGPLGLKLNFALVRADISWLPFASDSADVVHEGAALHCWPSTSNAVAEISRILTSGAVFVATMFLASSFGSSFPQRN